jgi:PAS domain S-box-containing protein
MALAVSGNLQAPETLRYFVGALREGIYVTTAEGEILDCNPALLEIFGVPALDDLRRHRAPDLWLDPAQRALEMERLRRDGVVRDFEVQIRRPDGAVRTVLDTCTVATDKASGRTLCMGVLVDISDRKRTELELANSVSMYRAILEATADGILVVDRHGKMVSHNRKFADMWRLPDAVMSTGDDDLALATVLDQLANPDQFLDKVRALYGAPDAESFDVLEFKDGRVFERYSRPQRVGDLVTGRVWSFRDVSERKRAEQALRSVVVATSASTGEEFFRTLAEHLAKSLDLRCALVGELVEPERARIRTLAAWKGGKFVENFEYDLKGAPCGDVVGGGGGLTCYPEGLRERFPDNALLRQLGVDSYLGIPLRETTGTVMGSLAVMHDGPMHHLPLAESLLTILSIRAATELERRKTAQRLSLQSTVMGSVANAIVITNPAGTIQWVNPAFTALTGYTEAEAIGQTPRILHSGRQSAAFYTEMWKTILADEVWTGEVVNRRKDGSLYMERMTITPVSAGGRITHFVAIKEDITAREEMGERLRQAQRLEAVGRLAGGVAHDFNNLLQAMLGLTQLTRLRGEDLASSPERLEELEALLRRGAKLTQQLLLFSRREEPNVERFDLNRAILDTAKLLRGLLPANVALALEPVRERLMVSADRGQIGQVWMNLAVNAADAMPDGGVLTVRSGRDGENHVWFSVTDTGHGISDDIRDRIFEPFFTTKSAQSGTGLGLAVVHGIVTQHGGRVEVTSSAGDGTTFKVVLPRGAAEAPASGLERTPSPALPRGAGQRVLLVEDHASVRHTFERLLTRLGYEVTSAGSAEEAEGLALTHPFPLLLTDMMLPGLSGADLAERLRQRWPSLKVILMSGYIEDEEIRRRAAHGSLRFLPKPVDLETLAKEVHAALDEHRSQ